MAMWLERLKLGIKTEKAGKNRGNHCEPWSKSLPAVASLMKRSASY